MYFIRLVSYRGLMTIYFKSRGICVQLWCTNWNMQKPTILSFFFTIVTKYINRWVLWVNLFTLYVVHHLRITQKPHEHFFQKSRSVGATLLHNWSKQKLKNLGCCFTIVTKYITRQGLWVNFFTLYVMHQIGITQWPHDHLFQKSGHLGPTFNWNMQKQPIVSFFPHDCNQIH